MIYDPGRFRLLCCATAVKNSFSRKRKKSNQPREVKKISRKVSEKLQKGKAKYIWIRRIKKT